METVMNFMAAYGLDAVAVALGINVLTGIFKMPVKRLAEKRGWTKITKYITFFPLVIGLGLSALYAYLGSGSVVLDYEFASFWLKSASLSLAIYAFTEKFFPSEKKVLKEREIKENLEMIESLEERLKTQIGGTETNAMPVVAPHPKQKIILRGNGNGEITTQEE